MCAVETHRHNDKIRIVGTQCRNQPLRYLVTLQQRRKGRKREEASAERRRGGETEEGGGEGGGMEGGGREGECWKDERGYGGVLWL